MPGPGAFLTVDMVKDWKEDSAVGRWGVCFLGGFSKPGCLGDGR